MDLRRWDGNPSGLPGATQALHHSATCCYTSGTENPLEETVWEREPVDDFEIVGERFRYLTLPNPWVDKLCTGTLWAQWP